MTERLYLTQPALCADIEILSCAPLEDGRHAVRLSATPFHPQGGGQPSDVGWLGEVEVLRVVSEGDDILHYTNAAVAPGPAVARVDAQPRQLHTRLHSAGHVIGHVMAQLGWKPTKAHHWPGEGRVVGVSVGVGGEAAQELEAEEIERRCNALLAQDLACVLSLEAGLRKIGFGDLPAYPCGGTHVATLGEIGKIGIESVRVKKGEVSIRYDVAA
ncbi:threonyl/alanyl tRNA synthetase SAD protein [Herbaspirillum rubrisubalbicans M1]|uniref:hypothetical protein n=1 Tax=Herbaspirillum rubrisubalbicans TaxID=80842 RepID=UPI00073A532A|nr:hypothetical protein [Herbaspirillum rubrisubalbicans]ALU88996.1 threonyl/alanyl tRNA synthetase SAD protein [Herbaspirillum rubrisubalbicans M1]